MNKYNVTLGIVVNVRMPDVEADTQERAIEAAMKRIEPRLFARDNPAPGIEFIEYADGSEGDVLVDEVGDEKFDKSRWFIWHDDRWAPAPISQQEELRLLDEKANTIRDELGCSQPGEVIWQARLDFDELLVVVADGYGRASLLLVSGNYPVEYTLKERRDYDSEDAAIADPGKEAAERES
jgi:hypothetical protein